MDAVTIGGIVTQGKRMGRKLGFPTANIAPFPGQPVPENGVYAGSIQIDGESAARRCLINHGCQPTLPSGRTAIEVYILDFAMEIYGKNVSLRFDAYVRPERKFASAKQLQAQIARDIEFARGWDSPQ